jgi:hypothetical protein
MTANAVETGLMQLTNEFLAGYLNGGTHTVNGASTLFPLVAVTNQRASIRQPLEGASLNITLLNPGSIQAKWWPVASGPSKRRIFANISLDLWVRAMVKVPRSDGHNSESLVRWVSDSIFAILINRINCLPLARKGIAHVFPRLGVLSSSSDYAMRSISVKGKIDFIVEP